MQLIKPIPTTSKLQNYFRITRETIAGRVSLIQFLNTRSILPIDSAILLDYVNYAGVCAVHVAVIVYEQRICINFYELLYSTYLHNKVENAKY